MNVTMQQEFELAYYDVSVLYISHFATVDPSMEVNTEIQQSFLYFEPTLSSFLYCAVCNFDRVISRVLTILRLSS